MASAPPLPKEAGSPRLAHTETAEDQALFTVKADTEPTSNLRRRSSHITTLRINQNDTNNQPRTSADAKLADEITESMDIVLTNGYTEPTKTSGLGFVNATKVQPAYELKPGVGVQYCP